VLTVGGLAGVAGCTGAQGGDGSSGGESTGESGGSSGPAKTETAESTADASGSESSSGSAPIVFGEPTMKTAQFGFIMPGTNQAIDLALKEINEEGGGLLGSELQIVRRETASKPAQFRSVLEQFLNNDGAVTIIRATSTELTPNLEFVKEKQVPLITSGAGTRALDGYGGDKGTPDDLSDDEWVWRTIASDSIPTAGAARHMIDQGYERMAIMQGNTQGERSWADGFESAYTQAGGTIVNRLEVQNEKTSYQSELNRLFQDDFDAWGLTMKRKDATTIIREWANAGYEAIPVLESGVRSQEFLDAVGESGAGALIASTSSTTGPNYDRFAEKFAAFGDADLHQWGLAGYDAVNVAALAAQRGGEATPETIQRNLSAVSSPPGTEVATFAEGKEALDNGEEINYQGALTPTDFTPNGNVVGDVQIEELTADGFEPVTLIRASEIRDLYAAE
jgi:ABC-type branched-subunit amino acid transport system substrate-binding protein